MSTYIRKCESIYLARLLFLNHPMKIESIANKTLLDKTHHKMSIFHNFTAHANTTHNEEACKSFLSLCESGNLELLQYLVEHHPVGIDKVKLALNKANRDTGLHLAVWNQHLETVDYLLNNIYFPNGETDNQDGINVLNAINNDYQTPAVYACRRIRTSTNIDSNSVSLKMFKLLTEYKCKLDPMVQHRWFPLYAACYYNNINVLQYMIDNKMGLDLINTSGDPKRHLTPLMAAISNGHIRIVQLLCSIDKTDIDNAKHFTALDYSAHYGNSTVLQILLRTLLKRNNVADWTSLLNNTQICNRIYDLQSKSNKECKTLISLLIKKGIKRGDYHYIASILRYNLSSLHNRMVVIDYEHNFKNSNKKNQKMDSNSNIDKNGVRIGKWFVGEMLGRGAFGNVLKGTHVKNGSNVALKFIDVNKLSQNNERKKSRIISFIMNELETLDTINHKNVIKLLAYNLNVDDKGTMLLVFEFAEYGELYQFLAINKYFNNGIAKTYFEQILDALEACHDLGIIHRDIKPQNILVDSKYQAKVADFGLSTNDNDITKKNTLFVGTRGYMSPEIASPIINDWDDDDNPIYKDITNACDIFSLGVILWQLLNGIESMPFDEAIETDPKYCYISQQEHTVFWKCHYNCRIVESSSTSLQSLLLQMFTFNQEQRITINNIRRHKWYRNVKGYNYSQESLSFFRQAMKKIDSQRQTKSTVQKFGYETGYQLGTLMTTFGKQTKQTKQTNFKFSQLR